MSAVVINSSNQNVGDATNLTIINCHTAKSYDHSHSGLTFVNDSIVTPQDSATASASAPYSVDGTKGIVYVDASLGDVTLNFPDLSTIKDCRIYFKRIDNSTNLIHFVGLLGTENLEFTAMPRTDVLIMQGEGVLLTSNGTDLFIL